MKKVMYLLKFVLITFLVFINQNEVTAIDTKEVDIFNNIEISTETITEEIELFWYLTYLGFDSGALINDTSLFAMNREYLRIFIIHPEYKIGGGVTLLNQYALMDPSEIEDFILGGLKRLDLNEFIGVYEPSFILNLYYFPFFNPNKHNSNIIFSDNELGNFYFYLGIRKWSISEYKPEIIDIGIENRAFSFIRVRLGYLSLSLEQVNKKILIYDSVNRFYFSIGFYLRMGQSFVINNK